MAQVGYNRSLVHGYFANMGGFVLQSKGRHPFPLNAETLRILVQQGVLEMPETTMSEIKDRSKASYFTRALLVLQIAWMVSQCTGRRVRDL